MAADVEIVGAGPSGLSAALTVVKAGGKAVVYERSDVCGSRFHGDFQGLENWTTSGDVLEELRRIGIELSFEYTPFHEVLFFDPDGVEHRYRSDRPLWYLVRRGAGEGTLDTALHQQAQEAGVKIRFQTAGKHLPQGGIVAHGPHRPDAIAVGYVFETEHPDGAYSVLSDELAPKGYSYLLICGGRGTIASCLFDDFHNDKKYRERTVRFFQERVAFSMENPRPFGGFGNVFAAPEPRKDRMLYVGEAAGFQDALFGFGMRYAMLSGHLAARAWLDGNPATFDRLLRDRLGDLLTFGLVNRFLFERMGNGGYARLLRKIEKASDTRDWMCRFYGSGWFKSWLAPIARRRIAKKAALIAECPEGCDCTWCRCQHEKEKEMVS